MDDDVLAFWVDYLEEKQGYLAPCVSHKISIRSTRDLKGRKGPRCQVKEKSCQFCSSPLIINLSSSTLPLTPFVTFWGNPL
jgi:hypothetical protein